MLRCRPFCVMGNMREEKSVPYDCVGGYRDAVPICNISFSLQMLENRYKICTKLGFSSIIEVMSTGE